MYSVGFEVQRMKGSSSRQPWMHDWKIGRVNQRHYNHSFIYTKKKKYPHYHLQLCQDLDDFASLTVDVFKDDHRGKWPADKNINIEGAKPNI